MILTVATELAPGAVVKETCTGITDQPHVPQ